MIQIFIYQMKYIRRQIRISKLLIQQMQAQIIIFIILSVGGCVAPGCQHPIFCNQKILAAVAQSNFYPDSKTFVDLVLKVSVDQALNQFQTKPLYTFLQNCFTTNNSILVQVNLTDWKENPATLSAIKDSQLKNFALDLNKRWNQLSRKVDLNYKTNCPAQCSSFLGQLNGRIIVVPGGRFQESYYWDTYWIIKGLISCDLLDTAFTLIQNFVLVIKKYGFIPNGFRQYYLNRSQPPFFALMVKQLSQALTKRGRSQTALALQQMSYPSLVAEHAFFMQTHSRKYKLKNGKQITLNYYNAETTSPRPESYREDAKLVENIKDDKQKKRILHGISSMAESGWDFSSRWLNDTMKLESNIISEMIPSDLNTLMGISQQFISALSRKFKRQDIALYCDRLVADRKLYFAEIFNFNYFPDQTSSFQRPNLYPSDLYPFLLLGSNSSLLYNDTVDPVTSSFNTGLQWDKPNVWAPNNWILHEVYEQKNKLKIAQEWVSTVYCSWKKQGLIYEKYRNDILGERGQGGEYIVQTGFGWTNGLALYYLQKYASQLSAPICP